MKTFARFIRAPRELKTGEQAALTGDAVEGHVGWEFDGTSATDLPRIQVVAEGDTFSGKGHYTATTNPA